MTSNSLVEALQLAYQNYKAYFPVLLACSGGMDSTVMFHLSLKLHIPFEVVHIYESDHAYHLHDAAHIELACKKSNIPFHAHMIHRLQGSNIEERGRHHRLDIFKELTHQRHLKAVLLAHHADDQAETILKRVLEGANLEHLHGMQEKSIYEELVILRPFLKIRKQALNNFALEHQLIYNLDETNENKRFLRTKMRKDILPHIVENFGKEIVSSLCQIGQYARELESFMTYYLQAFDAKIIVCDDSYHLDLSDIVEHSFIMKAVIKKFCKKCHLIPSNHFLEQVLHHLNHKTSATLNLQKWHLMIQKNSLTLQKRV